MPFTIDADDFENTPAPLLLGENALVGVRDFVESRGDARCCPNSDTATAISEIRPLRDGTPATPHQTRTEPTLKRGKNNKTDDASYFG